MQIGIVGHQPEAQRQPLAQYLHSRQTDGWYLRAVAFWALLAFGAFLYGAAFALFPPAIITPMMVPILIAAVVVIWALPAGRAQAPRVISWLFLGFFVSLVAWPNYLAVSLPGLPWITMARLFGIPLALVLLLATSVSTPFRTDLKEVLAQTPWIWKLLAGFALIQMLTIFVSANPFQSTQRFVISQITWTSMFFVSCYLFRKPDWVRLWSALLVIMAAYLCAIALWESRLGRLPWANHIPSFLKIEDESVLRTLAGSHRTATGTYRVQGTFGTSLGLAEYLALTTPFAIHFVLIARNWVVRGAAAILIPLMFLVIVMTDARLGAVGFLLSFLLYVGLWAIRRWRTMSSSILGPALTLVYPVFFVAFIIGTFFVGRLRRLVWGGGAHQYSTDARLTQLQDALPLIGQHPWGHGAGQGASTLGYMNGEGVLTIDSYFLTIALEYGVLGFLFFYGMIAAAMIYGFRGSMNARSEKTSYLLPAAVSLAVFFVIKTVFSQQESHPLIFMLLGMVAALTWRARTQPESDNEPSPV